MALITAMSLEHNITKKNKNNIVSNNYMERENGIEQCCHNDMSIIK